MQSKEANITPKVMKWFAGTAITSCPFEIKHTLGKNRFTLSKLSEHQRNWLRASTTERGITYKLVDANIGFQPFDCIHYKNSPAYVIIVYPTTTCAIHIKMIMAWKKPSITEKEAISISSFIRLTEEL